MKNKKIDKIIEAFRRVISEKINEEGSPTVNTQSSTGTPGFSAAASSPVAGFDPPIHKKKKKYIHGFKRKPWLDYLKNK